MALSLSTPYPEQIRSPDCCLLLGERICLILGKVHGEATGLHLFKAARQRNTRSSVKATFFWDKSEWDIWMTSLVFLGHGNFPEIASRGRGANQTTKAMISCAHLTPAHTAPAGLGAHKPEDNSKCILGGGFDMKARKGLRNM